MTEHKFDERLETQLHELYTTPEPNPAFTRLLRAQLLDRAERRRANWTARLWGSLSSAGRAAFSLGGAVLLVVLVLVGASLVMTRINPEQAESPMPAAGSPAAPSSTPVSTQAAITQTQLVPSGESLATPFPTPASTQATYKPPQLAPSVCDTLTTPEPSDHAKHLPEKVIGGGVTEVSGYKIHLYLFCDSSYQPDHASSYSEIGGLSIYQSYLNENVPFGGFSEYVTGLDLGGTLPDWSALEIPVRYTLSIREDPQLYSAAHTRVHIYYAALSFNLVNQADGFIIQDVRVEPLSQEQPFTAQSQTIADTVPTVDPISLHPLLGELLALQEVQKLWLYTGPGWIRYETHQEYSGMANDPTITTWYEVDEHGFPLRSANRETMPWGENPLSTKTIDSIWTGPQEGMDGVSNNQSLLFDGGIFASAVRAIKQGGTISKQELPEGVQFTITTASSEIQAVFNPLTGTPEIIRRYNITASGKKNLSSTSTIAALDRVDEPPPDILNLFE